MRTQKLRSAIHIALVAGTAAVGYAQSERGEDRDDVIALYDDATASVIPLSEWRYDELYDGWSAKALLAMPVRGPHGREIGEAKNLLVNNQGAIAALIAEVRGVGELGDTHLAVPWKQVELRAGAAEIPVTEQNVAEYGLFVDAFFSKLDEGELDAVTEDLRTGPHVWKVTELLDDYVIIEPGEPYGYVTDLVFDDAGNLKSVIVNASNPDLGLLGNYAYPWYGYDHGWRPEAGNYEVPYTREQIAGLTLFDYEQLKNDPLR